MRSNAYKINREFSDVARVGTKNGCDDFWKEISMSAQKSLLKEVYPWVGAKV